MAAEQEIGRAQHLHTFFFFPFSIDQHAIMIDHEAIWHDCPQWIDGLDAWIAAHCTQAGAPVLAALGPWSRNKLQRFDMDSRAYQNMVFFHPIVRRVFFDRTEPGQQSEALLRAYRIPLDGKQLKLEAEDARGRSASVDVTSLRLYLFDNSIGLLCIGVEARDIALDQALWINEMMRKVYPSSGRQLREGRMPSRTALVLHQEGAAPKVLVEERFQTARMIGYLPPLSRVIKSLLYFTSYERQEFEPVLDERMIVYSYLSVDPASVPPDYVQSREYKILISRFLWVDRWSDRYRYDRDFTEEHLKNFLYSRWAHQGTYYGFTSYSNVTITIGNFGAEEHELSEGFLIYRMFRGRYFITAIAALFYRATLLDFAEEAALVSRHLFRKYAIGELTRGDFKRADNLLSEFQHFSNYWYFGELANKDEEQEHFQMQCDAYRLGPMKAEVESEIEKLNNSLDRFLAVRNTEAVNRLAMISTILGGGAMITGFFGMNFAREFGDILFEGKGSPVPHYLSIAFVSVIFVGALLFAFYLISSNWTDYKPILLPQSKRDRAHADSLRRVAGETNDEEDA